MPVVKCPFCAEEIQAEAVKCKHCGEWLTDSSSRVGANMEDKGSAEARAVARGIKQEKADAFRLGCNILLYLPVAALLGIFPALILSLLIAPAFVVSAAPSASELNSVQSSIGMVIWPLSSFLILLLIIRKKVKDYWRE